MAFIDQKRQKWQNFDKKRGLKGKSGQICGIFKLKNRFGIIFFALEKNLEKNILKIQIIQFLPNQWEKINGNQWEKKQNTCIRHDRNVE